MLSQSEFRWQFNLMLHRKRMGIGENNPMEGKQFPPLPMLFLLQLSASLHLDVALMDSHWNVHD